MSLIDVVLQRRLKAKSYRPSVEQLEERQCLSVSAPTGLQLAVLSSTQIKATWNDVAGETGYRLFRWDGTKSVLVTTVAANIKTFTISQLQPNQVQWIQVEAFDAGTTARSLWASVTTPADAITVPTNVRVGNTTLTSVTLAWNNATGATGYRIFSWDGVRGTQLGTTTPAVPAFTINNLTPGTVYYFYVQAFNATNIANSDWVTAATQSQGLTAPTNLKTQAIGANTIGLSWNDVAAETGYRVYRWDGLTGTNPVLVTTLAANTTGFQVTGLLPAKTYWFYVQAFNANNFANTAWVTAVITAVQPLQAPTLIAQATGPNQVTLTWTEPARAVGYGIYVWGGSNWILVTSVARGTTTLPINGLTAYRTHWFMVSAFTNGSVEVAYSTAKYAVL